VCSPGRPCVILDYEQLVAFHRAITDRWTGGGVRVGHLRRPGYDATTVGRVVRYAPSAPACTVVHELAHVLSRSVEHGEAFWRAYVVVDRLAVDVWAALR
jgi:hypothetical protein